LRTADLHAEPGVSLGLVGPHQNVIALL
jgi:hypothetical protein